MATKVYTDLEKKLISAAEDAVITLLSPSSSGTRDERDIREDLYRVLPKEFRGEHLLAKMDARGMFFNPEDRKHTVELIAALDEFC